MFQNKKNKFKKTKISACIYSAALLFSSQILAQEQPPGFDIWVAEIAVKNDQFTLSEINNISQREGYDNQPYFLPNDQGILFTSLVESEAGKWQADTFLYDFTTQKTQNITNTPTISEYSPTKLIGQDMFSSVVVEESGEQKLWSYSLDGKPSTSLIPSIEPVGYHAWGEDKSLMLFVLGEPMTLQYLAKPSAKPVVIDENIGRSIRYNQASKSFTYIKQGKESNTLFEYTPKTNKKQPLIPLPKDSHYFTWLDDNTAISAQGNEIKYWRRGDKQWQRLAKLDEYCKKEISRVAVNQEANHLAFVCAE